MPLFRRGLPWFSRDTLNKDLHEKTGSVVHTKNTPCYDSLVATNTMEIYLGLSFGYHDAAVAAIDQEGNILFAEQEERISRIKHDHRFPSSTLASLEKILGENTSIEAIGYYEEPTLKESRKISDIVKPIDCDKNHVIRPNISEQVAKHIEVSLASDEHKIKEMIRKKITKCGIQIENSAAINMFEHHQSHASGAFFSSPFNEAAVVTMDGAGEYETVSIWKGTRSPSNLEKLWSADLPFSLGLFYSAITSYLAFRVNEGEYKVMGLSAYGKPNYKRLLSSIISFNDGNALINSKFFNFGPNASRLYTHELIEAIGFHPATNTSWVNDIDEILGPTTEASKLYCDLACSAQEVLSEIQGNLVKYALKLTGNTATCIAGGVALNSLANLQTDRQLNGLLYVFPPSGDAGSALGAAYLACLTQQSKGNENTLSHNSNKEIAIKITAPFSPYLGNSYTNEEYLQALHENTDEKTRSYKMLELNSQEEISLWLASTLHSRGIVGIHHGKGEYGPRALGNRSILASAYFPEMKERLNLAIKKREPYRPYAPCVASSLAEKYFGKDCARVFVHESHPLRYMASVVEAPISTKLKYPSAVHYDNTARLQILFKDLNPLLHSLSIRLEEDMGCGILLNTSFNLGYEALVGTPDSAVITSTWTDFDALLLGNIAISYT